MLVILFSTTAGVKIVQCVSLLESRVGHPLDRSQSLFYFVPQEKILTVKLARLVPNLPLETFPIIFLGNRKSMRGGWIGLMEIFLFSSAQIYRMMISQVGHSFGGRTNPNHSLSRVCVSGPKIKCVCNWPKN